MNLAGSNLTLSPCRYSSENRVLVAEGINDEGVIVGITLGSQETGFLLIPG